MGERGKTRQYGKRIPVRFRADNESELRVLAALWSVSLPAAVRILVEQGLRQRRPIKGANDGSSD